MTWGDAARIAQRQRHAQHLFGEVGAFVEAPAVAAQGIAVIRRPDDQRIISQPQFLQLVQHQAAGGVDHGDMGVGARDDPLPFAPAEVAGRGEAPVVIGQAVVGVLPIERRLARQRIGEVAIDGDVFRIVDIGEFLGGEEGLMRSPEIQPQVKGSVFVVGGGQRLQLLASHIRQEKSLVAFLGRGGDAGRMFAAPIAIAAVGCARFQRGELAIHHEAVKYKLDLMLRRRQVFPAQIIVIFRPDIWIAVIFQ